MAELVAAINALKAQHGSRQFNNAVKSMATQSKKTQKTTGNLTKSLTNLFAVIGTARFFKAWFNATAQQEEAEKTLSAAMKEAGTFTQEAFKANLLYAQSLQRVTEFGDERILQVQKMLTFFGLEGKMLNMVTKATLDLAAAKDMDLAAAGDLVAKSIGSSTNALTRYGIAVEGAAGSTERAESAVKNITAIFGGAAAAKRDTMNGALQAVKNSWGDVLESFGMANTGAIITTLNTVSGWFDTLGGNMDFISHKNSEFFLNIRFGFERLGLIVSSWATNAINSLKSVASTALEIVEPEGFVGFMKAKASRLKGVFGGSEVRGSGTSNNSELEASIAAHAAALAILNKKYADNKLKTAAARIEMEAYKNSLAGGTEELKKMDEVALNLENRLSNLFTDIVFDIDNADDALLNFSENLNRTAFQRGSEALFSNIGSSGGGSSGLSGAGSTTAVPVAGTGQAQKGGTSITNNFNYNGGDAVGYKAAILRDTKLQTNLEIQQEQGFPLGK